MMIRQGMWRGSRRITSCGFETVTYMLKGKMRHRDSNGNAGLLEDGAVQWSDQVRIAHSDARTNRWQSLGTGYV